MKRLIPLLLLPLSVAEAQTKHAKQPQNVAKLIVIALGPVPKLRYKIADAKDIEEMKKNMVPHGSNTDPASDISSAFSQGGPPITLPPLPGEVPPGSLLVKMEEPGTKRASDASATRPLPVHFNGPGAGSLVPGNIPLRLFRAEENGGAESYVSCPPLEPLGQYALLLYPTGQGEKLWEPKPLSRLIRLDGDHFPLNSVSLLNSSRQPVRFLMGDTSADLAPGNGKSMPIERKGGYVRCLAKAANSRKFIVNSAVPTDRGTRALYIFHDTDFQAESGKTIGVFHLILPETKPLPQ